MAINRFDQPAQAQFINTYSPLPFQELAAATQQRRGVLDENLARLDAARAKADQLRYIPGSEDEQYIKGVTRTMDTIADEFIDQDLSDPEIYRKLRTDLRTKINQGEINDIQSSYGAWASNQQTIAQLKKAGKYHQAIDLDPATGYSTRGSGVYGHQTEGLLDSRAAAEKFFNQIKASSSVNWDKGEVWSGVGPTAIEGAIEQNVGNFINTREGEQTVRLAANAAGVDYDALTQDEREGLATQYLRDVGQEFIFGRSTPLPASYLRNPNQGNGRRLTHQMQGAEGLEANDFLNVGNIKFDDQGNPTGKAEDYNWGAATNVFLAGTGQPVDTSDDFSTVESEEAVRNSSLNKIDLITKEFPILGQQNYSPQEIYNAYQDITKDMGSYRVERADMTLEQSEAWRERFGSDILDREISFTDKSGNQIAGAVNDEKGPVKELGYTVASFVEELKKPRAESKISVAGVSAGDGHAPGTIILQVLPAKGKGAAKAVHLSTNTEFKSLMTPGWLIHDNMIKGVDELIPIGYDQEGRPLGVRTSPQVDQDDQGKWNYTPSMEIGYIAGDRETGLSFTTPTEAISYSQINDYLLQQGLGSGYIGLDFHNLGSRTNVQ